MKIIVLRERERKGGREREREVAPGYTPSLYKYKMF
jgi:hypothetical protein